MARPKLRSLVTFGHRSGAAPGDTRTHGAGRHAAGSAADDGVADDGVADDGVADDGAAAAGGAAAGDTPQPGDPLTWLNAYVAPARSTAEAAETAEPAEGPADVPFWESVAAAESAEPGGSGDGLAPGGPDDDDAAGAGSTGRAGSTGSTGSWRSSEPVVTPVAPAEPEPRREGIGQHLGNLAHLSANPRKRAWQRRAIIAVVVFVAFTIVVSWRWGLTLAVLAAIADTIYRSRTTFTGEGEAQLTAAQRRTRKQLARRERAGYRTLHAVPIPGSDDQIDDLVVGRAGVFSIDSVAWDRRLPVRPRAGRELWLGPHPKTDLLEHSRWESERAAELLSGELGSPVTVQPAIAVYGAKVPYELARVKDVDVFRGPRLPRYLRRRARRNRGHLLKADDIERIDKAARIVFSHDAAD